MIDNADQTKKYAQDLVAVYKAEKAKRVELAAANKQLKTYAETLSATIDEVRDANIKLKNANLDTIERLAKAAEYKDEDTGDHIIRMSRYSAIIAEKMGFDDEAVENILHASPMHDIGKLGIPDSILLKPGKLDDAELIVMKNHTIIGGNILANSDAPVIQIACEIALSHHEFWNGQGYPKGLAGEAIPLSGRIVSLADVFDALTSRRPYKNPYPVEMVLEMIQKDRGEHFDPEVVDVFLANIDDMLKIKAEIGSTERLSNVDFCLSERDVS